MIQNYINGKWTNSSSKDTVDVLNPATGKLLDKCPLGNEEDVNSAIAAANKAFATWRRTPATQRVQPLFKVKMLMEENFEDLAKIYC